MMTFYFKDEMERRYTYQEQKFCKNSGFGQINKSQIGELNQGLFEDIVNHVKEKMSLIISMMLSLGFNIISADFL